jgi:hypothetical protein
MLRFVVADHFGFDIVRYISVLLIYDWITIIATQVQYWELERKYVVCSEYDHILTTDNACEQGTSQHIKVKPSMNYCRCENAYKFEVSLNSLTKILRSYPIESFYLKVLSLGRLKSFAASQDY